MKHTKTAHAAKEQESIVEAAHHFLTVTEDVAGEKVAEARKQLASRLESFRDNAEQYARKNPYKALGIVFGVGALFGVLFLRRH